MDDQKVSHYYGDITRKIFIITAVLMSLSLPIFKDLIFVPIEFSLAIIVALIFLAGVTNPRQMLIAILDFSLSLFGFIVFEYTVVNNFPAHISFAIVNQLIAALMLTALYYSTKTIRGFILNR